MTVNNVSRALRDSLEAVRGVMAAYGLGDAERGTFWAQWVAVCEGASGGRGGMGEAPLGYEPAGQGSQVATTEIRGHDWMFYVFDEDRGGSFGAVEIDDAGGCRAMRVASRFFDSEDACKEWLSCVAADAAAGGFSKKVAEYERMA